MPERLDKIFEAHATVQYQQDLLFSSQVDLMSLVVCGIHKSVHAAYRAKAIEKIVSTTALYNKLSGIELNVSQALLRETASDLIYLVQAMGGEQPSILPGYKLKFVDGTCLAATDHRLESQSSRMILNEKLSFERLPTTNLWAEMDKLGSTGPAL